MTDENRLYLIDTGNAGSPVTGDVLYDGGNKLNSSLTEIYNKFTNTNLQLKDRIIHTDGYYNSIIVDTTLEAGAKYDVKNSEAITLSLPLAVIGESLSIRNISTYWIDNPITVQPFSGQTINGNSYEIYSYEAMEIKFICLESNVWTTIEIPLTDSNFKFENILTLDFATIVIPYDRFDTMVLQICAQSDAYICSSIVNLTHSINAGGASVLFEEDPKINTLGTDLYTVDVDLNSPNIEIYITAVEDLDSLKVKIISSIKL